MPEPTRPKFLSIPDEFSSDVSTLLRLTVAQMKALAATQSTDLLKEDDSVAKVAKETGLSRSDALNAWSAASNIVRQRRREKLSDEALFSDLMALAPDEAAALTPEQKEILLHDVLADSDEVYRLQKAEYLRHAVVPALVRARSVCELRPVFDREKKQMEGAALVAVLVLTAHDEDHEDQAIYLQVTRSSLEKLKKCVDETERKLDIIEKTINIKVF
jgi:hypothetical protein